MPRIRSFQEPPVESSPLKCPALREKNGCGCSSCFCCHSEVIATQHPIIDRTLQNLRAFEKPESQQEGLETFLESISRKDLSGGNVREWTNEWIGGGILHAISNIVSGLHNQTNVRRLHLSTEAMFRLVATLPTGSQNFNAILERLWHVIRDKGDDSLAVYHVLISILEHPEVRKAAVASGFVNLLHSRNQSKSKLTGVDKRINELTVRKEDLIDDLYCHSPDVQGTGKVIHSEDDHAKTNMDLVVPRLNLTWTRGRQGTHQNWAARKVSQYLKTPKKKAPRSPNLSLIPLADSGAQQSTAKLFWPVEHFKKNKRISGRHSSPEQSPTSTLQTIDQSSIKHVVDGVILKSLGSFFPFGDPRVAWDQPMRFSSSQTQMSSSEREKCAIMEIFLLLSPLNNPSMGSISEAITQLILDELNATVRARICSQEHKPAGSSLRLCFAILHEYTSPMAICLADSKCPALLRVSRNQHSYRNLLVDSAREWLEIAANVRRPGETIFTGLAMQFAMLAEYISVSKSIAAPSNVLTQMSSIFPGLIVQLARCGHPRDWNIHNHQAFMAILELQGKLFERVGRLAECRCLLMEWCSNEDWAGLLEAYSLHVLLEGYGEQGGNANNCEALWRFFQSFFSAIKHQRTKQASEGQDRAFLSHGGNRLACGTIWGYLLLPRSGIVSHVLARDTPSTASTMSDSHLHQQVLHVVKEAIEATGDIYMEDAALVDFYLRLHTNRFVSALEMGDAACNLSTVAYLHFEIVKAIMVQGTRTVLLAVQQVGFVEYALDRVTNNFNTRGQSSHSNRSRWTCPKDPLFSTSDDEDLEEEVDELELLAKEIEDNNGGQEDSEVAGCVISPREAISRDLTGVDCTCASPPFHLEDANGTSPLDTGRSAASPETEVCLCGSYSDDPCGVWPAGLAITGDLEEDLIRWEAAELKASRDPCSLDEESLTSDSDDAIPLPAARSRPSNVPPLALGGTKKNLDGVDSTSGPGRSSASLQALAELNISGSAKNGCVKEKDGNVVSGGQLNCSSRASRVDDDNHLAIVEFLLEYLLLVESAQGSPRGTHDDLSQISDVTTSLYYHLNDEVSSSFLEKLINRAEGRGDKYSILLRLLVKSSFNSAIYKSLKRIHHGERAQVHKCLVLATGKGIPSCCAVKVVDFPVDHLFHACILDIFSEAFVLCTLRNHPNFSHLYDFGVNHDSIYLVMKDYKCSLLEWRQNLPQECPWAIRLLLVIFREILFAVQHLHEQSIVHFDLKCSNVLLDPLPGCTEEAFWLPEAESPNFRIVIADFGEARCYYGKPNLATVRTRGTEYLQSPEMLDMGTAKPSDYDRRRLSGAGPPSDVWGLGCLLFELVTGSMLQYDSEWMRFYARVMKESMPLIDDSKARLIDENSRPTVVELIRFMLVRNQDQRPSLAAMIDRVNKVLDSQQLPSYSRPAELRFVCPQSHRFEMHDIADGGVDLLQGAQIKEGHVQVTKYLHVYCRRDLPEMWTSGLFLDCKVLLSIFLDSGQVRTNRGLFVGMCSRTGMQGVIVDSSSPIAPGVSSRLSDLAEELKENNRTRLIVCSDANGYVVVEFLVELLMHVENYSRFEGILDVARCLIQK